MFRKSDCATCQLGRSEICRAIRGQVHRTGMAKLAPRRLKRNALVFEIGDRPGIVGILKRGYLRRERLTTDGQRMLIGLDLPGDLVGELPDRKVKYTLEAATDCEICQFEPSTVKRLLHEDAGFRRALMEATDEQLTRQLQMAWLWGSLTSRERIFAFLLWAARMMPCEPQPDGSTIVTMPIGRQDWADLFNTTMESISRRMTELSEAGLVTAVTANRYRIRSIAELGALAGLDIAELADLPKTQKPVLSTINAETLKLAHLEAVRQRGIAPGKRAN